ncbi:MAG: HAD-IC family P-type ATPase [Cellvibrionaceae bacterium]|nr:HAD-IC family P-type ATPase [Cellvibrionaceae bacterium]
MPTDPSTAPQIPCDSNGLSSAQAAAALAEHGPNRLPQARAAGPLKIFIQQFLSPFIYILALAAVVSFGLGQTPSGVFILLVLLLNAVIGTVQEYSAQQSAAALRKMVKGFSRVVRDGKVTTVDSEELVPCDLILISSGDKVPADVQLLSSNDLAVDESMLTGESLAVAKSAQAKVTADAPLAERGNQCFAGSIVTHGRAQALVRATALDTELGKIAAQVGQRRVSEPPLMIRIRRFTYQVAAAILLAILLLVAVMLLKGGYNTEAILLMSIGLAVSVIPEGLPAALTVALAIGMRRMARVNVIIRKLIAVEALGSCTFICSDKTGTLTVNELTIRQVLLPDKRSLKFSGEGIAPGGRVSGAEDQADLQQLAIAGVLANESQLDYAGGDWVSDGDIVDVAFLVMAKKLGLSISELRQKSAQLKLLPYESEKAFSGSLNQVGDKQYFYCKGSPEKILSMCDAMLTASGEQPLQTALIEAQVQAMAEQGYRLIALARRDNEDRQYSELSGMTYLGLVAMIDPLRAEAFAAVRSCREGGIEVAMVTGDHPATAKAIALELGLCQPDDKVLTGSDIRRVRAQGEQQFDQLVAPARVFARIEPEQKELIVASLMRQGHFVAVTGDGVNDAPAMRRSNAAIAMGKRGTDVAKESADLIITDDNFLTIVAGIEQGRVVYNNIRKVIGLLVATGFSAILLFFLTVAFGLPMPMIAVQLLWLNLVANGFQDVALAFEPKEGDELSAPPRDPSEPIFNRHIIEHVLVAGSTMGLLAFANFYYEINAGTSPEQARNLTLMLMIIFGNIHALNSRSESRSIFRMPLQRNLFLVCAVPIAQLVHIGAMYMPGISGVLQLSPISLAEWGRLLLIASSLLVVEELHKISIRARALKRTSVTPGCF